MRSSHLVDQPGGRVDADVGHEERRLELFDVLIVERHGCPRRADRTVSHARAAVDARLELREKAQPFFRPRIPRPSADEKLLEKRSVSVAHMVRRSNPERAPQGSVRIIAANGAAGDCAIPEELPCARRPIACARHCSTGCATRSSGARVHGSLCRHRRARFRGAVARRRPSVFRRADPRARRRAQRPRRGVRRVSRGSFARTPSPSARRGGGALRHGFLDPPYDAPLRAGARTFCRGGSASEGSFTRSARAPRACRRRSTASGGGAARAGAVEYGLLKLHAPAAIE